jgi:hypothetical protein
LISHSLWLSTWKSHSPKLEEEEEEKKRKNGKPENVIV